LFTRFVKGLAGNAGIAPDMLSFLTEGPENAAVTGSLLAQALPLWPVSLQRPKLICGEIKMYRGLGLLCAAVAMLAAGHAQAQFLDMRDIMGGGPNFRGGGYSGGSPIARTTVMLQTDYAPGTILISTSERRLYLVLPGGQALRYGIGVGRDGFRWSGTHRITAKKEWPGWTPPAQMLRRRPDLPRHMPGGIENPLGARAMYLGSTLYRIHGSNEPETIGQAVSSGCFRMTNEDVVDLYSRVSVGTTVVVRN
jgi:lipoprotein-anchoring transpeptidase ErfK/SrfK